jgi:hypothetical protein
MPDGIFRQAFFVSKNKPQTAHEICSREGTAEKGGGIGPALPARQNLKSIACFHYTQRFACHVKMSGLSEQMSLHPQQFFAVTRRPPVQCEYAIPASLLSLFFDLCRRVCIGHRVRGSIAPGAA